MAPRGGQICCRFEKRGTLGVIGIRDNGGGIPGELLPEKLFQPHVTTKGDQGTGIGLQISRWIIENHMKGKISAQNVEGGAEFMIELPLVDEATSSASV